ncbi:trehalose-phosphatase [Caldovatus sp. SYSU G05006]|uniref:Trehalose 6-phosphate phosphatase n=2 Tax=Caldovatus aquaticus TaxID=2865671 RepID=A0ABS7F8Y4_9PROT|nr:trehalose-phosphatase [Caldovatus aquaticus]MBW8271417.1 trehalose-phosphatase [Caldovatus aquaticus]
MPPDDLPPGASPPGLPPAAALFLDFDGTLVEIAPVPDAVRVPPGLLPVLDRLARRLEGALAVVSGRPIADLDRFLPLPIVKVGDHGATLRLGPAAPAIGPNLPLPPPAWRARAADLAARFPGMLLEDKAHGFVLHYRLAGPEAGEAARALLSALVAEDPARFTLLSARKAWEVRPRGVSKASAVAALMARPPFAGRVPVFIGDDATDEEGMAAARAAGGLGLRLQEAFGTPARLRAWLAAAAGAPADGAAPPPRARAGQAGWRAAAPDEAPPR